MGNRKAKVALGVLLAAASVLLSPALLAATASSAENGASAAPVLGDPVLPSGAATGSSLLISVGVTDDLEGVRLAVVRYRLPGEADFATTEMRLESGNANDGTWSATVGTGPDPGDLELYLVASDGASDSRRPAEGAYTVTLAKPPGPSLDVSAPASVSIGSPPPVLARCTDAAGVTGVRVHYRTGAEQSYHDLDLALRSGDERDGEWSGSLPAESATGEYRFFVVARNALSDTRSGERTIKVLPDLLVLKLTVSKKAVLVKESVVLSAVVANRADRPVEGLTVHFLDLSYPVGDARLIRILNGLTVPANGEATVSAMWIPQVDGERNIAVVLDPGDSIEEGDESDNRMEMTVRVDLEPGMGQRFPLPGLEDAWLQLTVAAVLGTFGGGSLFYGQMAGERRVAGRGGSPGDGNPKRRSGEV